jgi:hypothetical protein
MTQFFWQLEALDTHPEFDGKTDVVHTVKWKCRAIDAPFEASFVGSVPVSYDANAEFVKSPQLAENAVWDWVTPHLDKSAVETALQTNIDNQKAANNTNKPLTWSN